MIVLARQQINFIVGMICQVRAISNETKLLCSRSLLNLLTVANFDNMLDNTVIRGFAKMVTAESATSATQHLCAKAFSLLSSQHSGRLMLSSHLSNLQALFGVINTAPERTQVLIAKATFNMLSDDSTRVMSFHANAMTVIKIISTLNLSEMQELTSQILITIAFDVSLHKVLLHEPIMAILILFLNKATGSAFECAVETCALYSRIPMFRAQMVDKGIVVAFINASFANKLNSTDIVEGVLRCISFLSFSDGCTEKMVVDSNIMLVLHTFREISDLKCAAMVALTLRNLSKDVKLAEFIIEQHGIRLLYQMLKIVEYSESFLLCQSAVIVMENLAKATSFHSKIIEEGIFMEILLMIASIFFDDAEEMDPSFHELDVIPVVAALHLVAETSSCHKKIVESSVVATLTNLLSILSPQGLFSAAKTICSLASSPYCRQDLVDQNAVGLILSIAPKADLLTQSQCTLALAFLSACTHTPHGIPMSPALVPLSYDFLSTDLCH